ncbi:DUF6924 domain-containing protein [Marinactinospora rubrisoli]|uniref:DUF6924 domain-containing protein n=1 Tax=Marinactinospora rubrisoli TaxID=2715399 RepID=A0ABW2KEJ8_9ACTN
MSRPALPAVPRSDTGEEIPGFLLVRTGFGDEDAWQATFARLAGLPGVRRCPVGPRVGHEAVAPVLAHAPKQLVVVDDLAWRGATTAEVCRAVQHAGSWRPELVLLADDRTMADPVHRPLLAFTFAPGIFDGQGGAPFVAHERVLRIGARQTAMLYLVFQAEVTDMSEYKTSLPAEPDDIFGADLDLPADPPRYRHAATRMRPLPHTESALIVRTDHSDDEVWAQVVQAVKAPSERDGFLAHVDLLDDPAYAGATMEQVMALVPSGYQRGFLMIADEQTIQDTRRPLLLVDLYSDPGLTFRATPGAIQSIEINLSIGNMDFRDFHVPEGEIFAGF